MPGKIDVHTHALPDFYSRTLKEAGDVSGAPVPKWSLEGTLDLMNKINITTSIVSLSAPGAEIAGTVEGARALAREYNNYASEFRAERSSQLGFFTALPGLNDVDGTIAEIKYGLDDLKADGVTLFTSYDGKYLGHKDFTPIWEELDKRSAVVFIHPCHSPTATWTSPLLPQPIIDYPHETTRTASDLIVSGTKRRFPNCKIILSHAGGTLPYLVGRLQELCTSLFSNIAAKGAPTGPQITEDAKSFYFDTALGGNANILDTLLKWAPADRILYGSDYPYCTTEAVNQDRYFEEYEMSDELREKCTIGNALKLFPRLR